MVEAYRQVNTWLIPGRTRSITQPCWIIIGESGSINDLSNLLYSTISLSPSEEDRSQKCQKKQFFILLIEFDEEFQKAGQNFFEGILFRELIPRYAFLASFVPSRAERKSRGGHVGDRRKGGKKEKGAYGQR